MTVMMNEDPADPSAHEPKPAAYVVWAENGNCIMWTTNKAQAKECAERHQRPMRELYDQDVVTGLLAAEEGAAEARIGSARSCPIAKTSPQQATPDLADGPARMHWTNWMPVKDALEYAYQKMGLEMVKTDAGAKYPNLHWNLAGLVREFVVAQQDAMFGKCQACGKNVGLLDQIKCLDCGTRLCEPCAKEHFGSDHGARAAASHSHPAPTTSGWVETSAPPQRLDWSDTQQATPERCKSCDDTGDVHDRTGEWRGVCNCPAGDAIRSKATPEPVGEPLFWYRPRSDGGYEGPLHDSSIDDVRKRSGAWMPLFTHPAPGVPEGLLEYLQHVRETFANGPMAHVPQVRGQIIALDVWIAALAAAQAKGGQP